MIALTLTWSITAFVIGYLGGTHDVRVIAWILLVITAVMWVAQSIYNGWVRQRNASDLLRQTEARRRQGGAL